ncbi:MAG: LysR family transcriptional regulator [Pseudomonadota bacterium]
MIRNFDIEALRAMVVGVDLGSFTRAASELGRSQSAISMQVKKLEERAGKPLFVRQGRGLVPNDAGEQLLVFARKIIALNDEAAIAMGVGQAESTVRLGLPQDFFETILPETLSQFADPSDHLHVDVRAGRNAALEDEVLAGRIDVALALFPKNSRGHGDLLATLPTFWFGKRDECFNGNLSGRVPLVLYDHPCLFRTQALKALEMQKRTWRVSLTTPSLAGVWAAVEAGRGVTSRTAHLVPSTVDVVSETAGLPSTPDVEVRLMIADDAASAAQALAQTVEDVTINELAMQVGSSVAGQ